MQLDDARSCRRSLSHGLWHRIKWDHVVGVGWTAGRTGVVHDAVDAHEGLRADGASPRCRSFIVAHADGYVLHSRTKLVYSTRRLSYFAIQQVL